MLFGACLVLSILISTSRAFVLPSSSAAANKVQSSLRTQTTSTSTSLFAIAALVKKAKKEALKQYVAQGVPENVMEIYKTMMQTVAETASSESSASATGSITPPSIGPLQQTLTRRKGTITVVAEFKRKMESGFLMSADNNMYLDSAVLGPLFRISGASAVAVLADENMGGCTYQDLQDFVNEQSRASTQVPGPLMVINNDVVIDELQIARSKSVGVAAVVVPMAMNGKEQTQRLLHCCRAVDLECIVAVEAAQEAQDAVDIGATMISVVNVDGIDEKVKVISDLNIPEGRQVTVIANIIAKNDSQWQEVEEAWALRDKGFNCAWVGDALYKSGSDTVENPGAIIKAMKSKSSLKWASPKAYSGRGEGAKEYLGDILM